MATQSTNPDFRLAIGLGLALLVVPALAMSVGWAGGMHGGEWAGHHADDGHGWMADGGASWSWMLAGGVIWTLLVVGVAMVLFGQFRSNGTGAGTDGQGDPALEALRVAYARGEVEEAEFERRRQRLGADGSPDERD